MPAIPSTKKGRRTRDAILEAAGRVFSRDGYVDARMSDIATEAGLSTGGLYRYYDNKTDVFAALIADLHEEFYDASGHTGGVLASDPLEALRSANRAYIELYHKNRHVMRAFIEAAAVERKFRVILREMRERHVRRFSRTYRELFDSESVRGVSIETMADALSCMVEQCCYAWFAQDDEFNVTMPINDAVTATSEAWFATIFERNGQ
jgi:AcrR family transcriptional regulator